MKTNLTVLTTMPAILSGCSDWMQSDQPAWNYAGILIPIANDEFALVVLLARRCRGRLGSIATVKSIHASRGVDQLLLTRKERMAGRANFHVQITFSG